MEALKKFDVYGLKMKYFIPVAAITLFAVYGGYLPGDMGGTVAVLFVIAGFLFSVGKAIPVLNKFGAPVLLPLFGGALMSYFNLLPENTHAQIASWVGGWQNLFVGAVLVGSMMMVNRKILLKSVTRFIPAILAGHLVALVLVGIASAVTGMGVRNGLFQVAVPILSGGVSGPSAVLGPMYTEISGQDYTSWTGLMVCYDNIANVLAIVSSGMLARFCLSREGLAGHGNILIGQEKMVEDDQKDRPNTSNNYNRLGTGALLCSAYMVAGAIISKIVPINIHAIAWAIVLCIISKGLGILPQELEDDCVYWNQFIMKNFLAPLVFAIGVRYLDLAALAEYFTPLALLMIALTLFGATAGSMIVGRLVGLYPLETGLSAGLCSCNSGGSGDIACLSAADCMAVLPFASIATRIGGGLMLIWASLLFPYFV